MATKYGELFSDEYQKSLKEQIRIMETGSSLRTPADLSDSELL